MLKLKEEFTGFIYDSENGYVKTVFTKPINAELVLVDEDDMLVDNDNVNELFEITSKEGLENDVEGLNKVLEWVDSAAPEYGMFINDNEWEKEMGR